MKGGSVVRFPQLNEMSFRRDQVKAVLIWPLCAARGHPERYEIAAAGTVSFSEAAAVIVGLMSAPEPSNRTIRYFACRCGAHTRSEPV
jgi:hypothetical protein